MKERKPLDAIDKIIKDPVIRNIFLNRGVEDYQQLLRDCKVNEVDVGRNTRKVTGEITPTSRLPQKKAKHFLTFIEKVRPPKKTS